MPMSLCKSDLFILQWKKLKPATLRRKCSYSELFWSIFSRIRTEYVGIVCVGRLLAFWDRIILYFCSFLFFDSSIIKFKEVGTNHFLVQYLKNEILRVKYVKPMWEKLLNSFPLLVKVSIIPGWECFGKGTSPVTRLTLFYVISS